MFAKEVEYNHAGLVKLKKQWMMHMQMLELKMLALSCKQQ
jgi:hypothetical protein